MSSGSLLDFSYYFLGLAGVWWVYLRVIARRDRRYRQKQDAAREAGLLEPASLHPVIDPNQCVGCGACVTACPENEVLGVIGGKAELVNPTRCIGHGACKVACPMDAITLVFGSAQRGVDLPVVQPNFETNVPGIYIAGELGGMGLIRNAVEQGRQAMQSVATRVNGSRDDVLDVAIIGAGPAGISASLAAKQQGLRFVTLEQDTLGGTVSHFPRGKIVMTSPAELPLVGKMRFRETTKERLIEFWTDVERKTGLTINYNERVEGISRDGEQFEVRSSRATYRTKSVLLAIGRRGTPRKLDVPGEESAKVVYRLVDPAQYRGNKVLVVGGGDSALEAALSIAGEEGTQVTLSYRGDAFSRAKEKNRNAILAAEKNGTVRVMLQSQIRSIGPTSVEVDTAAATETLANDFVIVCAGGVLPTGFLRDMGVAIETKYGTA